MKKAYTNQNLFAANQYGICESSIGLTLTSKDLHYSLMSAESNRISGLPNARCVRKELTFKTMTQEAPPVGDGVASCHC